MYSHRKAIRKKVRELLKDKTLAGENVFTNQASPSWVEQLPIILIYTKNEDIDKFNQAPRELKRDLNLVIEIVTNGSEEPNVDDCDTVEDILDDLSEQVECIMSKDQTLGETADDSILSAVEQDFTGEGKKPIGSLRLFYTITYVVASPKPECQSAGLGNLELGKVDWKVGHHDDAPDDVIEAKDDIEFDQ